METTGALVAMRQILIDLEVEHRLYQHRPIRNFDEADLARQESGFEGAETKSMVLKSKQGFLVYTTPAGRRIDFGRIRAAFDGAKVRLATPEDLAEHFAAEPGCAYPFGFAATVPIYLDPALADEEWLVFGAGVPTITVQLRGADLRRIYDSLPNPVTETSDWNQPDE